MKRVWLKFVLFATFFVGIEEHALAKTYCGENLKLTGERRGHYSTQSNQNVCFWACQWPKNLRKNNKAHLIDTGGHWVWKDEAKKRGLVCGKGKINSNHDSNKLVFSKHHFNSLSVTQRKQLQYALKELGYYTSSVDGLYGPNTERAVRAYAKNKGIKRNYPNSVLRQLTAEVSVPSSFATAKKTTSNAVKQGSTKSHYNGLKRLVSNPSLSAKQAWIKCATRANTAHRNAYKSYSTPKYGSTTNCTLNATRTGIIINGNLDCESSPQHGGFVGGITNTLGRASVAKAAAESTMSSCLTKHGWKR